MTERGQSGRAAIGLPEQRAHLELVIWGSFLYLLHLLPCSARTCDLRTLFQPFLGFHIHIVDH